MDETEDQNESVEYTREARLAVIQSALGLEKIASELLSSLLNIERKSSLTLGSKSSSLSFKSKVELLIDIGALSAANRKKFISFMEIRNQFFHNEEVQTFADCYSNLEGVEQFLKKNYLKEIEVSDGDIETINAKLFFQLVDDVVAIAKEVADNIVEKRKQERAERFANHKYKRFFTGIEEYLTTKEIETESSKDIFILYVMKLIDLMKKE